VSADGRRHSGRLVFSKKPQFPLVLGTAGPGWWWRGSRVRRIKIADQVYSYSWANPKGGFYAEFVAVAADKVAQVPARLDLEHAGAIATSRLTALRGIDDALELKRGDTIIIHGASGGVGTLAIQFTKLPGARVLATRPATMAWGSCATWAPMWRSSGGTRMSPERLTVSRLTASMQFWHWWAVTSSSAALKHCDRLAYPNGIEPEPKKRRGVEFIPYDGAPGVREFQKLNAAIDAANLKVPIAEAFALVNARKVHERLAGRARARKDRAADPRTVIAQRPADITRSWRSTVRAPVPECCQAPRWTAGNVVRGSPFASTVSAEIKKHEPQPIGE
jgi:NADPH:quinone reductase